ncbi:kinase [Actinospica durhamensis]|uniref:Kinase n=1 Tax=Actinospica durhamensis TaxID=1508375 RepID=A0A941ESQ1_9ACTN|nr:kinase [Actinospica durhamensis]MBR7835773.1 kinase [Actinospica durhamensis]
MPTPTGSTSTQLIILRGNSGSGKSTVAARLRAAYGRGIALVPQDLVRREILRERDVVGAVNVGLLDVMVRHVLDQGIHVVLEGILYAEHYGRMLTALIRDHAGATCAYYFDIPYEATLERHWTKPNCDDWTPQDMREWYRAADVLPDAIERIIGPESSLDATVQRILADTTLLTAPRPPQPGFTERPSLPTVPGKRGVAS